jgi:hypothetical protein
MMKLVRLFWIGLIGVITSRGAEIQVNAKATALQFEHACQPGPAVEKWREEVRGSVFQKLPRPEPPPVFRYIVRYSDGKELPVVVRWSESVESAERRMFEPVSRFISPMAWAEVTTQGAIDPKTGFCEVRYTMQWPNPFPEKEIASVSAQEISGAGKALVFSVKPVTKPLTGKNYYVAPGGNDENPGSFEQPWATPHKATAMARAGDTVYFREGTYAVTKPVIPSNSGKEGAWITFCNYPGESAIFTGREIATDRVKNELVVESEGNPAAVISTRAGVWHILGTSFIRIQGLAIQDSAFAGISVNALPWWPVDGISQPDIPGCSYIDILHNRVQRTSCVGIGVYGSIIPAYKANEHIRVIGNLIMRADDKETILNGADQARSKMREELRKRGRSKGGDENLDFHAAQNLECAYNEVCHGGKEGIDLMNGTRNATVHHNFVHDQFFGNFSGSPCAIYLDCRSEQWDIEVAHNVCERNGQGIQVNSEDDSPAHGIRIHDNICRDNYWNGINISMWTDKSKLIRDVIIEKNIVLHNGFLDTNKAPGGGIHIGSRTPNLRDIVVRDNIVAFNRDYQLAHFQSDLKATNIVFDRNQVWPKELKPIEDQKWAQRYVPTLGDNAIIAEPIFVDPENYDFALKKQE